MKGQLIMPASTQEAGFGEEIFSFDKNSSQEVRFTISEYRGKMRADIRVWNLGPSSDRDIPTKQGLNILVEQLPDLLDGVQTLHDYCKNQKEGPIADQLKSAKTES